MNKMNKNTTKLSAIENLKLELNYHLDYVDLEDPSFADDSYQIISLLLERVLVESKLLYEQLLPILEDNSKPLRIAYVEMVSLL